MNSFKDNSFRDSFCVYRKYLANKIVKFGFLLILKIKLNVFCFLLPVFIQKINSLGDNEKEVTFFHIEPFDYFKEEQLCPVTLRKGVNY